MDFDLIPTKCDCCGNMVIYFSDKGGWFGKYLKSNETQICHNCIKGRRGYAEEFLKVIGVSVETLKVE